MSDKSITLITAFFDIGRGNISEKEFPSYLKRTNETYFEYFSHLASLENEMIVFTSKEFVQKIASIRKGKPTKIIPFDLSIFDSKIKKISSIQQSDEFKSKVNPQLLKNIEYWSSEYVLVTNLKSFFVSYAIKKYPISSKFIAWIDFGYVRDIETLCNIKKWEYKFNPNQIHLFTILSNYSINNESDVYQVIFNNIPVIAGGVAVATKENWKLFYRHVVATQNFLLKNNVIDDDQGVYLMTKLRHFKNRTDIKLNYLGRNQWFSLFKRYGKTNRILSMLNYISYKIKGSK